MELTPQTLHAVEFREARRGGYNTRDVDDFLERVAAGVALVHDRMRDAMARAEGAEGRLAEVQRQLEEAKRRPAVAAAPEVSETDDTLRRTLVLAQRTADATIKEAKDEAARLLSEAREEAAHIHADIEAEARRGTEGARLAAEAEIEQLLEQRDSLKGDLEALDHRIEDQRASIRAGITELERVLDDPVAFKPRAPVPLTEVDRPPLPSRGEPLPSRGEPLVSRGEPLSTRTDERRIEIPAPPIGRSNPSLPMRKAPSEAADARNGHGAAEPLPAIPGPFAPQAEPAPAPSTASPFSIPAAQVAALQDAPPLPQRNAPALPPAEPPAPPPATFPAFGGAGSNGSPTASPWPSELRTSIDDAPGGPGGELPLPPNGGANGSGHEQPGRPSEWGRPVFEVDEDADQTRYGRR